MPVLVGMFEFKKRYLFSRWNLHSQVRYAKLQFLLSYLETDDRIVSERIDD